MRTRTSDRDLVAGMLYRTGQASITLPPQPDPDREAAARVVVGSPRPVFEFPGTVLRTEVCLDTDGVRHLAIWLGEYPA